MFRAGIPQPELQYAVADENGELIGLVDFAWPEFGVIVEFDGKAKYSEAFFAYHDRNEVFDPILSARHATITSESS